MGWQLYRGKQAQAPAGCSFLDSENEWEKVKLCFEMIKGRACVQWKFSLDTTGFGHVSNNEYMSTICTKWLMGWESTYWPLD